MKRSVESKQQFPPNRCWPPEQVMITIRPNTIHPDVGSDEERAHVSLVFILSPAKLYIPFPDILNRSVEVLGFNCLGANYLTERLPRFA